MDSQCGPTTSRTAPAREAIRPLPLAIDLFCGLGGWTEGLLAEGYRVVGFDNERHAYGDARYPAQLVLQDVLTIHGSQFKDAALIVASPPCQAYSYRAMPWKRAKALPPPDNSLFEACFRIQREAIEAAGHHIPLVVENVCGAQKWVGRARWHYGSFYLWGDVPALMPITRRINKGRTNFHVFENTGLPSPSFHGAEHEASVQRALKATKNDGGSWFAVAHNTTSGKGQNPVNDGIKARDWKIPRTSRHSSARKAASAHIAKIPLALARHIAKAWYPPMGTSYVAASSAPAKKETRLTGSTASTD